MENKIGSTYVTPSTSTKLERIDYDPDEMLDLAIAAWLRGGQNPFPSRVTSEVDLDLNEVHLENVNGRLATYRILPDGGLRKKRHLHIKDDEEAEDAGRSSDEAEDKEAQS